MSNDFNFYERWGGGGGGSRRTVYPGKFSVMGNRIFTDLKKQKADQNKQCRTFISSEFLPNDFHVLIKKA